MTHHSHWSDRAFKQALATGTFPVALFTHEAHLRLAWLEVQQHSLERAMESTAQSIQQYIHHLEAPHKYHHTLTLAAVQVVAHFTKRVPTATFEACLAHFPRLRTDFKGLLLQHYSPDRLYGPKAQHQYMTPHLMAFS